jgi:hypothetical protein
MQSESIAKLMPALLKAQKAIASVKKDSKNPHLKSNYASIEAVIDAIKLALNDNDIVFIQPLSMDNDKRMIPKVLVVLLHTPAVTVFVPFLDCHKKTMMVIAQVIYGR